MLTPGPVVQETAVARRSRAWNACVCDCTSHQSNTHSTESREVLYPWHPWFGRSVWIHLTRLNHGRMVAHCGLDPQHGHRGVEVPLWMFDAAVCCQMHRAAVPVVSIEALHELAALLVANSAPDGGGMLQAQHDSLLPKGGADANSAASTNTSLTCCASVRSRPGGRKHGVASC